jgi:hypothetical protein
MSGDAVRPWPELALGVLAVWRVTHLLHAEHGPWGVFERARGAAARAGLGAGVACFWCLSVWTAAPAAWWMASGWGARAVAWLALSAGAILIEVRLLGGPVAAPVPFEEEESDELLRERGTR